MKEKKWPLRLCTGCGEMKEKRLLVRVVASAEGEVLLDTSGRAQGRGAYICKNPDCLQKAHERRGLERSLKRKISPEIYENLKEALLG